MKIPFLMVRMILWNMQKAIEGGNGFFSRLLGCCFYDGARFTLLYYIVNRYRWLVGWDANQVLFLFAFHLFTYSVSAAFCRGLCLSLPHRIQTGELDQAFIKPVHPLLYIIFQEIDVKHLCRAPVALFAMCYAYGQINVVISPISILLLSVMLVSALISQSALWVAASALHFLVKGRNLFIAWIDVLSVFTRYPLQIYGTLIQVVLTFLVPLGFASYYPASVIAGAATDLAFPRFLPYTAPMVGLLLMIGSVCFWRYASGRYQGVRKGN